MGWDVKYQYPGDAAASVKLVFGGEFLAEKNREIRITTGDGSDTVIPVDDVVCDFCNTGVMAYEPCALAHNSLYCWECFNKWIKPHLVPR